MTDSCDVILGCSNVKITCDDDNACTQDSCDAVEGFVLMCSELGCTSQTDYDACTTDTCDAENGCTYTPVNCNDNYLCTSNSCDSTTGNCNNTYISCDDENACMDDSCNALTGCTYCAVICDYYNACTPRLM